MLLFDSITHRTTLLLKHTKNEKYTLTNIPNIYTNTSTRIDLWLLEEEVAPVVLEMEEQGEAALAKLEGVKVMN